MLEREELQGKVVCVRSDDETYSPEVCNPAALLGCQLAVLLGDGCVLSHLDQQLLTRLTLLTQHHPLLPHLPLKCLPFFSCLAHTLEGSCHLVTLVRSAGVNVLELMNKPERKRIGEEK